MTAPKRPLRLGDKRPWGETTCGYGLEKPECDRPATRHFKWVADNSTSAACDEHAAYIHSRNTTGIPFDEHAFGGDCGMPGVWWHYPYEDEDEGYCFFPSPDDASLLAEEPVLVGITAALTEPTEPQ